MYISETYILLKEASSYKRTMSARKVKAELAILEKKREDATTEDEVLQLNADINFLSDLLIDRHNARGTVLWTIFGSPLMGGARLGYGIHRKRADKDRRDVEGERHLKRVGGDTKVVVEPSMSLTPQR